MFNNYPHINKISKDDPNFIVKSLADRAILKKEFYVLVFLNKYSFTPKVCNFNGNFFCEERLTGKDITKKDLTNANIKKIALTLKKLHTLELPLKIKKLIKNNFLVSNRYRPFLIAKEIIKNVPSEIVEKCGEAVINIAKDLELRLKKKEYNICLIHGDLNRSNIFIQSKNIFLIDWTDCRLDISSCDIAQLFYSLNFNQKQENLFFKHYGFEYIYDRAIIFHKILLLLYDSVNLTSQNKFINKKRIKKLSLFCENYFNL